MSPDEYTENISNISSCVLNIIEEHYKHEIDDPEAITVLACLANFDIDFVYLNHLRFIIDLDYEEGRLNAIGKWFLMLCDNHYNNGAFNIYNSLCDIPNSRDNDDLKIALIEELFTCLYYFSNNELCSNKKLFDMLQN